MPSHNASLAAVARSGSSVLLMTLYSPGPMFPAVTYEKFVAAPIAGPHVAAPDPNVPSSKAVN